MLRGFCTAVFCLTISLAGAQELLPVQSFAHEIALTSENDAYLFRRHDAYYTNGIFFRFSNTAEKNAKKILRSYEAGQMIYTPLIRKTQSAADIDRPYCGFLFARYTHTAFTRSDGVLQYAATLGAVGNLSLGENLQNSYHRLLGYGRFTGWQYQVENAIGLDLGISYARTIWEDVSWAKLVPQLQASLGTNYTNAKAGLYVCIGAFEQNSHSALWNARITSATYTPRRKSELFAYWYPELTLQGYNATLQGGLLAKGKGTAVLAEPERLVFQHTAGICYAANRWSAKISISFQDREAHSQTTAQQFGSMQLCYRMR